MSQDRDWKEEAVQVLQMSRHHLLSRECQVADWTRHAWNCVPMMDTEFEGKGRGVVAARDIKMGEFIFLDKPAINLPMSAYDFNQGYQDVDSVTRQNFCFAS